MTDITDPEVVRYCNVYLRPFAEQLRDIKAALTDATAEYTANVNGLLSQYVSADPVIDGRDAEGIGRITKIAMLRMRTLMTNLSTVLADASVTDPDTLLATFTVRPLRIGGNN